MNFRPPATAPAAASAGSRLDAGLWFVVCALVLCVVPIGFVSNDGLGHSRTFATGDWALNPNHLLFEPLGAAWQSLWARLDPARAAVDALKLLSALAGALAVALFRRHVAPLVTSRRGVANYATAWVGLSSAFLRLWVSDEIHMIQMPFVVALAGEALRLLARPTWRGGLRAGVATGFATLCFISNALLGASLALALLWRQRADGSPDAPTRSAKYGAAAGLAAAALLVTVPLFLAAAGQAGGSGGGLTRLSWMSHGRLGADRPLPRGEAGYGIELSARGMGEALLRAGYGSASALVDLTPLAAAVRDRQAPAAGAFLGGLAFLAAAGGMLAAFASCARASASAAHRDTGWLALVWFVPILGFGFLWNNSDDQFYFQLAPVFGLLAAVTLTQLPRGRLWLALGLAALAWNLADVSLRRISYPRAARIAELAEATAGACLVVVPGFDEAELLLRLSPAADAAGQLSIVDLATRWPPQEGIPHLLARIAACRSGDAPVRRVVFVDLFDTPEARNPWKYLRRLGYDHRELERRIAAGLGPMSSRRAGPFALRVLD